MDDLLLDMCFEILQEYVERYVIPTFPRESVAESCQQFYESDDDREPTDDESVMTLMEEVYELYDWWTVDRPQTHEAYNALILRMPNTPDGWPDDWMDEPKYQKTLNYRQWMKWSDEYNKMLEQITADDDAMLAQLLEIRRWLWDDADVELLLIEGNENDTITQDNSEQSQTADPAQ